METEAAASTTPRHIADLTHANFHCIPLDAPDNSDSKFRFSVSLQNGELHVDVTEPCNEKEKMLNWIKFVLQPKLLKWARSGNKDGKTKSNKSLGLVDIEDYTNLYAALKEKYGKDLVDRWTETTDPLKFVYEDVAIATYLILLWRKLGDVPNNFIDMGCGNGLLVHILNSEGYHGYGVDIRKRKIWDIYPETTKLKEHTIIPNDYNAYKDVDWIIGNHSDELSPWIPVITAMSSYKTKYFLLPCCAYEFSGKKFQRRCANESVYNDFLNYVQEISAKCQFKTDSDRLKIPSTKRVAIIGSARSYLEEEYQNICQEIDSFVKSEIQKTNCGDLKLREKEEAVRNCTKIDKNIIDNIVMNIFQYILRDDGHNERVEKWRSGRSVTLQELASFLSKDDLKNIKSECGGLKTLIKNKHEIFEVLGDKVKLRYPRRKEEMTKIVKFKRRPCFFYLHHPDGCALTSIECTFVHERINV
ncbi:probable tRNA (uracil-O(2)-)-methyltransferase isoform X3 [Hermetia illucens]|uniref:probable tRNA (uracil-O(2)-)-methyltransferase isoform X3 n=1 Tax=Hermetia illucens TaxID=343691 RepID=UPI0018CC6138|nr:probable tRNA (uracil-O(2)-)-methyltransferase isoform X3 [Hermetia illucens]